jgi:hypothetical protein
MKKTTLLSSLFLLLFFSSTILFCGTQQGGKQDTISRLRLSIEQSGRTEFDKFIQFEAVIEKSLTGNALNTFLSGLARISDEVIKGQESKWDLKKIEKGFKTALAAVPKKNQEKFAILFKNVVKTGMSMEGSKAMLNRL